ncbi:hypothetical protein I551_1161 [Mycobacterium ulcerans str. Harvey]|uniref:Uncharacterized protein n=1 Tax=Mycobacterium ulcerans str. Harvey TaxID=1299332 RepID=A0ABN0R5N6_MYCUL|nr:hypothetical protein I551_1161 [Mycobacterium ulcerans str. Harvey]
MAKRGFAVSMLTVVRPGGAGPLVLAATSPDPECRAAIELYGPHQRSGGALRQLWWKLRLRGSETAPLQASMRRAVEHRALMAIAIGEAGVANTSTIALAALDREWTLYAHNPVRGTPLDECTAQTPVGRVWESLRTLNDYQISHGTCAATRSQSMRTRSCSGGSATPNMGPPTPNSSRISPNSW